MGGRGLRRAIIAVIILALLAITIPSAEAAEEDADGGTVEIKSDSIVSASGYCGSSDSYAAWFYSYDGDYASISVSGGLVSSYGSGSWTLTALTVDGSVVPSDSLSGYSLSDVFRSRMTLTIAGEVSASSGVFSKLNITAVSFSEEASVITAGMFSGCAVLASVDLTNISSIGAEAFSGCVQLRSVDLLQASVDPTAFDGCRSLSKITATGSANYTVIDNIVYSDGGRTLHLRLPSDTGVVGLDDLSSRVTKVNLGCSSVVYTADVLDGRSVQFVAVADDVTDRLLEYSSLGLSGVTVAGSVSAVTVSYSVRSGWELDGSSMYIDGGTAAMTSSGIRVTFGSTMCTLYPMGVEDLTYSDLESISSFGDWTVIPVGLPSGTGTVGDIEPLEFTAIGYSGPSTAELDGCWNYHGVICRITSVYVTQSSIGQLSDLIVGEGVEIRDGAFTGCSGLRSITADHVESVGEDAFRYCTNIVSASFASCSEFGARAFDNCWSLSSLELGADSVSFGDDAFRGCNSLELIAVELDAVVSGADGVSVLHYETDSGYDPSFEVQGSFVLVTWTNSRHLDYSETLEGERTSVTTYSGYVTTLPLLGEMYVWMETGGTSYDGYSSVVFDYGLGMDATTEVVRTGSTLSTMPTPEASGYNFAGWLLDGELFDPSSSIEECIVLVASWYRENALDATLIYLAAIFGISVLISFAIFLYARRS